MARYEIADAEAASFGEAPAGADAFYQLGMMYSTTAEEWGEWLRWAQIPIFLRTVALVAFIREFDDGRPLSPPH